MEEREQEAPDGLELELDASDFTDLEQELGPKEASPTAASECLGLDLELSQQSALVKKHAALVRRIAYHLLAHLPQTVQLDDLIQAGMIGLLEAEKNYDPSKGAAFETYAGIRIRGSMLDEVRRNDWVPRSVYRNSRLLATATRELQNRLGRDVKDTEVAAELNISLEEFHAMQNDSASTHLYGFEDLGVSEEGIADEGPAKTQEPHILALQEDRHSQIAEIIHSLPKNEQLVLSLYYEQDLNLKAIGDILGVSESRVSQIHSQATEHIRNRLPDEL